MLFSSILQIKKQKNQLADSKLLLYVLPCGNNGSPINVEIRHEKQVVAQKRINVYEKFEISNPRDAYYRYTIKIRNERIVHNNCDLMEVSFRYTVGLRICTSHE